MLLKIGTRYINTDHVVKWDVNSTNGGGSIRAIDKDGENIEIFHAEKTAPEVMIAIVRWLDANSTDIMATEPAPVETPNVLLAAAAALKTQEEIDPADIDPDLSSFENPYSPNYRTYSPPSEW